MIKKLGAIVALGGFVSLVISINTANGTAQALTNSPRILRV